MDADVGVFGESQVDFGIQRIALLSNVIWLVRLVVDFCPRRRSGAHSAAIDKLCAAGGPGEMSCTRDPCSPHGAGSNRTDRASSLED